jgi:hypothetical protein
MPGGNIMIPAKGSRWRHTKGQVYVVTGWSNMRSLMATATEEDLERREKYPPRVHYSLEHCEAQMLDQYSRELHDWDRSFTPVI